MRREERHRIDYNRHVCSPWECVKCLLISIVISGVLAWLFYRSWFGMMLLPVVYVGCLKAYKKAQIQKKKDSLLYEFKDMMQALSAALLAGYSMENAWRDVERELRQMHGEQSLMYVEVQQMNAAIAVNEPIEQVFLEFAKRSGCEEIESFAEVFVFAKRSGGDFVKIIRVAVQKLTGKIEVEKEIATVLAGKKLEGHIMNAMPLLVLAYMTLCAGDFLDVLYGNLLGIGIMSGVLAGYVVTLYISTRILDIRV